MPQIIRVALPGYDCLTDTNPNHFALYTDGNIDYILIKEKLRAKISVNGTVNINHNLNYVPYCLVFAEISTERWRKLFSTPIDSSGYSYSVNTTQLVLSNTTGVAKNYSFYIFFDNIT